MISSDFSPSQNILRTTRTIGARSGYATRADSLSIQFFRKDRCAACLVAKCDQVSSLTERRSALAAKLASESSILVKSNAVASLAEVFRGERASNPNAFSSRPSASASLTTATACDATAAMSSDSNL